MRIYCPKCHRILKVKRKARTLPQHHMPDVIKTWAKVTDDNRAVEGDGIKDMLDVWPVCPWSGARFKVVWR